MIGTLTHLFPLSIYRAKGGLTQEVRDALVKDIDASVEASKSDGKGTWTGDVEGYHSIHNSETYRPVFNLFGMAIMEYIQALGVKPDVYDTYFTRSWAVRQKDNKIIEPHTHAVSHLTGVYYPKVHKDSGNLVVGIEDNPNELFSGLFNPDSYQDGTLDKNNPLCVEEHGLDVEDDLLMLFPSKTLHKTSPNISDNSRYSISTDVLLVLKDANRAEHGIPPIEEWRKTTLHG